MTDRTKQDAQGVWVRIGADGRVVVPAPFRRVLGIEDGGPMMMYLEDGELRLMRRDAAVARAQALVAQYVPKDVDLVDGLLVDRRHEEGDE